MDHRQKIPVAHARRLALLRRLVAAMGFQDLVPGERLGGPLAERAQRFEHAALPVDQRAVAVECQDLEIAQAHGGLPSMEAHI